jgi:pyruvate formate lyase activating enzyme
LREASASRGISGTVRWEDVLGVLRRRIGLLDGVVFTGGEPLSDPALPSCMREVRAMGFAVGLHTGGALPGRLAAVLDLVDWIGFDVKAPFEAYETVTRTPGSGLRALESLRMLVARGVDVETRTTIHPDVSDSEGLALLGAELQKEGVADWVLQEYRPFGVRPGLRVPDAKEFAVLHDAARRGFPGVVFRG